MARLYSGLPFGDPVEGGGQPASPSGESKEAAAFLPMVGGFAPWGGIAESTTYRHLADPSGIVTGHASLMGGNFEGAMLINPSEVLGPQ